MSVISKSALQIAEEKQLLLGLPISVLHVFTITNFPCMILSMGHDQSHRSKVYGAIGCHLCCVSFFFQVTVLGLQTWMEQNDKLVSSKMRSSMGFQAQQSPLHFLTPLFSPQFGPSLLHEEKQKKTSTSTIVEKQ